MNSPTFATASSQRQLIIHWLLSSGAFLFIYAYSIFRFSLCDDEIFDILNGNPSFFIATDRWGTTLFRLLTSEVTAPLTYGLFSAASIGLAIALQIDHFLERSSAPIRFLYIAIHLGIYQILSLIAYSPHVDAICFGYLLMTAGYLAYLKAIHENKPRHFITAVICFVLGTSIYQTLLLMPVIFALAELLRHSLDEQKTVPNTLLLKQASLLFGLLSLAALLYITGVALSKQLVDSQYVEGCADYRKATVYWNNIPAQFGMQGYIRLLLHIAKNILICLVGGGYKGNFFYATAIIPIVILFIRTWKGKLPQRRKWLTTLCVVLLWVLPFAPILAIGQILAGRTLYAAPCACALLWCLCLQAFPSILKRIPIGSFYAVSAALIVHAGYVVTHQTFRSKLAWEARLRLIEEVQQRAWHTPVPDGVDVFSCPIAIIGELNRPSRALMEQINKPAGEYVQQSIRIRYVHPPYLLKPYIKTTSHLPQKRLDKELSSMSIYPASGSCRYVDGEILVRMQ